MSSDVIVPWAKADLVLKPELVSAFRDEGIFINYISDAAEAIETLMNEEYPLILIDMDQTTSQDIGMKEKIDRLVCGVYNESWKIGDYVLEKVLSKKSKNRDSLIVVTGKYNPEVEGNLLGVGCHVKELGAHSYYHMQEGISGLVKVVKSLI
ncbi:hypothetical protein HN865_04955 [Candidatus Woesearchaeota archaeon]|jgi:hypothetical protein|nr:hypothetical protein [Candidatus Woesearchaeota archaeon]MBT7238172.1 hypothetical protein [Candidatus Woesearchaeota archaeon]